MSAVGWGQRRSAVRAFRWLGRALLAAVVCASWMTVAYLDGLPVTDASGQGLIFVWRGHDSDWWRGAALGVALVTSLALFGWLFSGGVRLLHGPWRKVAVGVAVTVWLVAAAVTVVVGGMAMVYVGGTLTTVPGPGGMTRVVTQDEFDGDVVEVYRPLGRFRYLREAGDEDGISLDPRRGPCTITEQPRARRLALSCGDSSYPLR